MLFNKIIIKLINDRKRGEIVKKITKKIYKEYDGDGKLIKHTEEIIEEETKDNKYTYMPYNPYNPPNIPIQPYVGDGYPPITTGEPYTNTGGKPYTVTFGC